LKNKFDPELIKNTFPSGSRPGKLYRTVKVHKENYPIRPVVSMIRTPEYKLAKFLDSPIKPFMPDKDKLKSTEQFLEKLKSNKFDKHDHLVSFDVKSLFTNVPLLETIEIIASYIYQLYKQVDGVTMGSPLGPTLANFFLAHMEHEIMKSNLLHQPKLYLRFIDDIFAVFDHNFNCNEFLDILNRQHKSIKFTVEKGGSNLSFLDTEIRLDGTNFNSCIWRKLSYAGLLLNYNAYCPKTWKSASIKCFLTRAKMASSTQELFEAEVQKLRSSFWSNGYPKQFFEKTGSNSRMLM